MINYIKMKANDMDKKILNGGSYHATSAERCFEFADRNS